MSSTSHPVLYRHLTLNHNHVRTRDALVVVGASLALWASAKFQIPFWPVPMTLQTLVCLLIGVTLGPRLGVAAVALYLAQGAMGLPVFAGTPEKGLGLAYMAGPTGGYLLGFFAAVVVTGMLAQRGWDRRPATMFVAMLAGALAIYVPGVLWLGSIIGWDKPVFALGVAPFFLADVLKVALATALGPVLWRLLAST